MARYSIRRRIIMATVAVFALTAAALVSFPGPAAAAQTIGFPTFSGPAVPAAARRLHAPAT